MVPVYSRLITLDNGTVMLQCQRVIRLESVSHCLHKAKVRGNALAAGALFLFAIASAGHYDRNRTSLAKADEVDCIELKDFACGLRSVS